MLRSGWEIYYNDLSVYTDANGSWGNAPTSGVLIVCECFDDGHKFAHIGMDHYYMDPMPSGGIGSCLETDEHLSIPESGLKTGSLVDQEVWNIVHVNVFGA
jgi:hypothetical protein